MTAARSRLIEAARSAFAGGGGLLETMSWPKTLEDSFFAHGADRLPEPVYEIDRPAIEQKLARLTALEAELEGDDALVRLLHDRVESHRLGARMMLAMGTKGFGPLCRQAYGGARGTSFDSDTTNLDFAEHLALRLGASPPANDDDEPPRRLDAAALGAYVAERLAKRRDAPKLEIVIDDELSAKALAGKKRLRIRADATFELEEARSLYLHEVETHVFTAQNGDVQPELDFLDSGGPLTTRTQEGLAVFAELYAQALTLERLRRLVERVRLVAMAEDGGNFLDLYRYLVQRGIEPRAAFLDVARVCRGGPREGGAPFTKDAAYLAGLVDVYDFLRLAASHDRKLVVEVLVTGRVSLTELEALVALRREGVLAPPRFVPSWLRRWDDLVAHFAFTSFLGEINLGFVAKRYAWLSRPRPVEG